MNFDKISQFSTIAVLVAQTAKLIISFDRSYNQWLGLISMIFMICVYTIIWRKPNVSTPLDTYRKYEKRVRSLKARLTNKLDHIDTLMENGSINEWQYTQEARALSDMWKDCDDCLVEAFVKCFGPL